jgi:kumamolisin
MYERTFAPPGRVTLTGSIRNPLPNAREVGDADEQREMTITVYVRRRPNAPPAMPPETLGVVPPQWRARPNDEAILAAFSADPEDLDAVEHFGADHNLKVVETSPVKRSVRLQGTVANFSKAFGVRLSRFQREDGLSYRGRTGPISLPTELAPIVEAVFGLDNRPMGRAYLKKRKPIISRAQPPRNTYLPPQVAQLYNFPPGTDGSGQCIAIFAFNGQLGDTGASALGGYDPQSIKAYFEQVLGIPMPQITTVVVHGPGNVPGDGTQDTDATGEVLLDIQVAGGVAPGAKLVMYFTEFTEQGWVDAVMAASTDTDNKPSIFSISYGNPEDGGGRSLWTQDAILKVNEAFHIAALRHITICCASGDDGSNDQVGDGFTHCDFPSSSPYVLGIGGTRLESTGAMVVRETTWNDGPGSATGGGVSRLFQEPTYQTTVNVPVSVNPGHRRGRGVPDVAAVGDPDTGYVIVGPSGQLDGPIGGTSAAAPLWAGLIARLNQALGVQLGFFNPMLYRFLASGVLRDIVTGNNFSYSAGPGYDACTGLGSPDGVKLVAGLQQLGLQPPARLLAAAIAAPTAYPPADVAAAVNGLVAALQRAGIPLR